MEPTPDNGVYVFARVAHELGRIRPDIPVLVVEEHGTEADLAACGLDLRGVVSLMPATADPSSYWTVTRILLVPALGYTAPTATVLGALAYGIPVIGSDRAGLPATIGPAGVILPVPERITPATRVLPTPEEVAPWVEAIVRLWDDRDRYEELSRRARIQARRWTPPVLEAHTAQVVGSAALEHRPPPPPALPLPRPKRSIEAGIVAIRRRWPELHSDSEAEPVFLLAAGWRSGSTLLQRLIVGRCFLWGEPFGHAGLIDGLADPIRCFTDRWPEPHHFHKGADAETVGRTFIANLYPPMADLLRAHQAYFEQLFAEPARREGAARWGFKEVRLTVDHALYLQWLFPRAKFLFLIRNPYDAWRSYAARAAKGWTWYNHWPNEPVTVRSFAAHWARLATSFRDEHAKVGGLVVRYEDLARGEYAAVEEYLGFPLSREAGRVNPSDGGPPPLAELATDDRRALEEGLGPIAAALGYEAGEPRPPARVEPAGQSEAGASAAPASRATSRCVVLVPVGHSIEGPCDDALRELERRGYAVRRVRGYSAIDQGRNQIATDALRDGFDELMWIDADIAFQPEAVERLRSHGLPISCGVYPKKGKRAFACNFPDGMKQVVFGAEGGLVEVPYAGAGFLHTRREVYDAIRERFGLPSCNERFGPSMVPYFQPLIVPDGAGHWYLAEDFSFCHRARACGFRILADTSIRLRHLGVYAYGWEDAGGERPRHSRYTFHVMDP